MTTDRPSDTDATGPADAPSLQAVAAHADPAAVTAVMSNLAWFLDQAAPSRTGDDRAYAAALAVAEHAEAGTLAGLGLDTRCAVCGGDLDQGPAAPGQEPVLLPDFEHSASMLWGVNDHLLVGRGYVAVDCAGNRPPAAASHCPADHQGKENLMTTTRSRDTDPTDPADTPTTPDTAATSPPWSGDATGSPRRWLVSLTDGPTLAWHAVPADTDPTAISPNELCSWPTSHPTTAACGHHDRYVDLEVFAGLRMCPACCQRIGVPQGTGPVDRP